MILSPEKCQCPLYDSPSVLQDSPLYGGTILFMMLLENYLKGRCALNDPCRRVPSVDEVAPDYDFIVVGGGTAGSIVAGRLSENTTFNVLLLEAGDEEPVAARVPSFYGAFHGDHRYDWMYRTVPDDYCLDQEGKGCQWPRGKVLDDGQGFPFRRAVVLFRWSQKAADWLFDVLESGLLLRIPLPNIRLFLKRRQWFGNFSVIRNEPPKPTGGGTSVLNGMMYHRGHAADYESWVKAGATGWSWEENLPYFYRTEGNKQIGTLVSGKHHSDKGPLPIQQFKYQPPFANELLSAVTECGLPVIQDMNDPDTPDGFCFAQAFNDDGQRWTTARAYLKPRKQRPNLSVKLNAHATRVLLDGRRAIGVEYLDEKGETRIVRARKEVILSAGALNSPQLLMLSGIGPRETLERLDIPVVADLPVGRNMRNHYGMTLYFVLTKLNNTRVLDWNILTQYLLNAEGPMTATGITQLTGLLYSSLADRTRKQPDLQFFFNGFYAEKSMEGEIGEPVPDSPQGLNISANVALLIPHAIGLVTINSSDPLDPPLMFPGYFRDPRDIVMIKDGARYLQTIFNSKTLKNKFGVELDRRYTAKCSRSGAEWSDSWLECMARLRTDPQNHQFGTAAIGRVVDTQLRVNQVTGLRVIDASVMPTQVSGNPQGPIMMVAERGAAFIKKNWEQNEWARASDPSKPASKQKQLLKLSLFFDLFSSGDTKLNTNET